MLDEPTVTFDIFYFLRSLLNMALVFLGLQICVHSTSVSFSYWTHIYWVLPCGRHSLEARKITVNTTQFLPLSTPKMLVFSKVFSTPPLFYILSLNSLFTSVVSFSSLCWWFKKTLLLPTIPLHLNIPKTLQIQCFLNQIQLSLVLLPAFPTSVLASLFIRSCFLVIL